MRQNRKIEVKKSFGICQPKLWGSNHWSCWLRSLAQSPTKMCLKNRSASSWMFIFQPKRNTEKFLVLLEVRKATSFRGESGDVAAAHLPGFRHFGSWNFGLEFPGQPQLHSCHPGWWVGRGCIPVGQWWITTDPPIPHQNLHFCPSKKAQAPRRYFGGEEEVLPRAPMTSIFEGQPPQNKAFSYQNKGHLGSRLLGELIGPKIPILHRAPATKKKTLHDSDFDDRKTPWN